MKNSNKLLNALLIFLIVVFVGCKGDDGQVGPQGLAGPAGPAGQTGPQGPQGESGTEWSEKEGFARGSANVKTKDGGNFNWNFDFQGIYYSSDASYTILSDTETEISIEKLYAKDGEPFIWASLSLEFTVENLNTLNNPKIYAIDFNANKELGNNEYLRVYKTYAPQNATNDYTGTGEISNLNYNPATGILTGNFNVHFDERSDEGEATITNGTFSSRIIKARRRVAPIE